MQRPVFPPLANGISCRAHLSIMEPMGPATNPNEHGGREMPDSPSPLVHLTSSHRIPRVTTTALMTIRTVGWNPSPAWIDACVVGSCHGLVPCRRAVPLKAVRSGLFREYQLLGLGQRNPSAWPPPVALGCLPRA